MQLQDPRTDKTQLATSPTGVQHNGGYADAAGVDLGNGTMALLTVAATRTKTTPAASATSVQLLAADSSRVAATIVNTDPAKKLYLGFNGAAAVVGVGTVVAPKAAVSVPAATIAGQINGIWEAGPTGTAAITATTA